ncbi:hypothetical protein F5888DRAFT_1732188 [Russula emetica]|nr:hypothetical protein F5888DRAFT_1732188 [Russula emetica]
MVTSTVGADAAKETLSVSLPSNDTSMGTTPPTSSFPTATTMAMAMATESAEIECLNDRAATPKSHRYSGSGSRGHKSYDRCQSESSSAVTSSLAWWEMTPAPPALLLWAQSMIVMIGSVYAIAKTVLGCKRCCSQPRDSTDLACEISSARAWSCSVWYGGYVFVTYPMIRNGSSLYQCYDVGICTLLEGGLLGARSHDKVSVRPACMSDLGHGTQVVTAKRKAEKRCGNGRGLALLQASGNRDMCLSVSLLWHSNSPCSRYCTFLPLFGAK